MEGIADGTSHECCFSLLVRHALLWSWGPRIASKSRKIAYCVQSVFAPTLHALLPGSAEQPTYLPAQLPAKKDTIGDGSLADNNNKTYLPHINNNIININMEIEIYKFANTSILIH